MSIVPVVVGVVVWLAAITAVAMVVASARAAGWAEGDAVVVTRGMEGCLNVYAAGEWQGLADRISAIDPLSRDGREILIKQGAVLKNGGLFLARFLWRFGHSRRNFPCS